MNIPVTIYNEDDSTKFGFVYTGACENGLIQLAVEDESRMDEASVTMHPKDAIELALRLIELARKSEGVAS